MHGPFQELDCRVASPAAKKTARLGPVRTALEKLKRLQLENDAATRQSLISRLHRLNDCDSWSSFFELYWRLIYATARDAGLSNEECEDVVQETVISVAKAMPEFHYNRQNGSFRSWLFQL